MHKSSFRAIRIVSRNDIYCVRRTAAAVAPLTDVLSTLGQLPR